MAEQSFYATDLTSFTGSGGGLPDMQPTAQRDSTFDKIINTAGDVGGILSKIDQAINPNKYQQNTPQNTPPPQPQQAGFGGVLKWLLIAGVVGTGGYYLKEHFEDKKKA